MARHHASHVPCDVSSRRCFLLQTQAVLFWATMLMDESLLRYSCAIASLLVAVFSALRFSRIPAAQALCADVDNPLRSMVYSHGRRSFEAARNDAALASVPSCRSTHICRLSPSTYCCACSGTPRRVFSACFFLAVRQLSYCIREEYGFLRGVTSHRLLRL